MITPTIGLARSLVAVVAALLIAAAFARPRGLSPGELLRVADGQLRIAPQDRPDPAEFHNERQPELLALGQP